MDTYKNKFYKAYSCSDTRIFDGYIDDYEIPLDISKKISKDLGFSYDLYQTLMSINREAAESLIDSMSKRSGHQEIILLIDDHARTVVGYTLDTTREPLLNDEFMTTVARLITSTDSAEVVETHYLKEDTISTVLVKKVDPIIVEEKYENKEPIQIPYHVGILIMNDELTTSSCRLVLYVDGQPVYLPASLYSVTASRYKRSTSSAREALEVLILKVIDDLRDDYLKDKIYDMHFRYRYNKKLVASYEEYNTLMNAVRKIPTIIEDTSFLSPILHLSEEFEKRYMNLLDKKSSYIWRCTALGEISIEDLMSTICSVLTKVNAPPMEYFQVRELLGSYVNTPRIAEDIAKGPSD